MARAAVIPQSPAKRTGRASTQSTAAADAKRKATRKPTPVTRPAARLSNVDPDSTDDELDFTAKAVAKPRGRQPARPVTKPQAPKITRGRKATVDHADAKSKTEVKDAGSTPGPQVETTKKRVGRPRKSPLPEETAAPKPNDTPKARGRPKATAAAKAPATAPTRRTRMATEAANETKANSIKIATNSTTMRSNILRGPAKKKTVTFQETSESDGDDSSAPEAPAAGRKRAAPKATGAGKAGLGGTPVRKAATATRGRKPAATATAAAKPLSPKKAKQVAKSLSEFASSDDEDELNTIKAGIQSPVKLVVHSPVKHAQENTGLSSPVRRINFTPKKAGNLIDENGEPKLPTPKHGSEGVGLSSPVRRINFTPNRSQHTVVDNGHLALPPGNSVGLSESKLMSSPARRALTSSPFKFSLRDTPNRGGPLFFDSVNPVSAPDFTPAQASPLKMSPKKANLGASFSQSLLGASTQAAPARTPLIQSPAKRIASPFKSSMFSAHASVGQPQRIDSDGTPTKVVQAEETTTPKSSPVGHQHDRADSEDSQLIKDVARDIFDIDIELSANERTPSPSPHQLDVDATESDNDGQFDLVASEMEIGGESGPEQLEEAELADEAESAYEEPETICFDAMEEENLAPEELFDQHSQGDSEHYQDDQAQDLNDYEYEYEEAETLCFDVMENAELGSDHYLADDETHDDEDGGYIEQEAPYEYEEASTLCFDAMEDEYLADYEVSDQEPEFADSDIDDTNAPTEEPCETEDEVDEEIIHHLGAEYQSPEPVQTVELEDLDVEEQTNDETMSENTEVEDNEPTSTIAPSPREFGRAEASASPVPRMQARSSPVGSSDREATPTPTPTNCPANTENDLDSTPVKNVDLRVHTPLEEQVSYTPSTQADSPALMVPSLFNTPSVADQRHTPNTGLGLTPLAERFDRWEQNTPSQARSLRPRRRGVFSLVGPLDRTAAQTPTDSGTVSYPDLSKSPLANTPSLFAELPLQPQSDDTISMSPEHDQTPRPVPVHKRPASASPIKCPEIFEDPIPEESEPQTNRRSILEDNVPAPDVSHDQEADDKENCGPANLPVTPMKSRPQFEDPRTVHTVSKVPLKAEGEVSPFKSSRKRGLSLSITSPTRSSPRVRKPTLPALNDIVPILSPTRRTPRVSTSPTPKRRSIMGRRSSGRAPVMAPPGTPTVTGSPAKKPRRSINGEQKALHGAVVHVDVHTTEGEDASGIFVELLQQMGARCVKSWSWNPSSSLSPVDGADPRDSRVGITHVVYKDGGLRTLEKVKKAAGLVKCVGVGWVLDCEREKQWLDETPYAVDSSIIPRGGAKRRKSMEPRALSNINGRLVRTSDSPVPSAGGRRSGVGQGAVDGFRKITPPTHHEVPSTPTRQSAADEYQFPATPGYNFANLDAIGMSPATPGFLGNRSKLVQQSCPPKQSNRGLFPGAKPSSILQDDGDDEESRRQRRFRMEAARRKSLVYKPAVASPLVP